MTVDNSYALFYGTQTAATNWVGTDFDWLTTETYNLTLPSNSYLYVVTASDLSVAQGFLGQFTNLLTGYKFYSSDPQWEVMATGLGPSAPYSGSGSDLSLLTNEIVDANAGGNPSNGWVGLTAGPSNGAPPWGTRPGIDAAARWVWYSSAGDLDTTTPGDPTTPGFDHDEWLVFRISVAATPDPGICRTAGFWGTHADDDSGKHCSQNITAQALDLASGDDIVICGETITRSATINTPVDSAASAVEALCVRVRSQQTLQLARQLTAMSLNCLISGFGETCAAAPADLADLFNDCNVGDCSSPSGGESVGTCITKVDCANNGGNFNTTTNQCELGNCSISDVACNFDTLLCATNQCVAEFCLIGGAACSDALPCGTQACIPFANSCHTRNLPSSVLGGNAITCSDPGAVGSDDECKAANNTMCTILPLGEGQCDSNSPD